MRAEESAKANKRLRQRAWILAGVVVMATIEDTTADQLDFVRRVNFDGPFFGCKHAIPAMAAGGGGAIVNISSAASLVGTPAFAAYSANRPTAGFIFQPQELIERFVVTQRIIVAAYRTPFFPERPGE